MLHLIHRLVPRPVHRSALRVAHTIRHRWRIWRKVRLEGVSIIVRNSDGEILLVRHAYGPQVWTLPGGGMKRGEDPAATAQRELREELGTGLVDAVYLGVVDEIISASPHTAHVVTGMLEGPATPDRREIAEAAFFAPDKLPSPLSTLVAPRLALLEQG